MIMARLGASSLSSLALWWASYQVAFGLRLGTTSDFLREKLFYIPNFLDYSRNGIVWSFFFFGWLLLALLIYLVLWAVAVYRLRKAGAQRQPREGARKMVLVRLTVSLLSSLTLWWVSYQVAFDEGSGMVSRFLFEQIFFIPFGLGFAGSSGAMQGFFIVGWLLLALLIYILLWLVAIYRRED